MRAALSLCFLFLLAGTAGAQEYRATVLGSATDPSGAAVPKASVIVTNSESGVRSHTETYNGGAFQVPYLLPGSYTVEVSHPGFKTHRRGPIELRVDDRARIDVALQVGSTSDQVTVVAEAPLLEETTGSRGQVVSGEEITSLPLDGHNPFTLMNLGSGVLYRGSCSIRGERLKLYFRARVFAFTRSRIGSGAAYEVGRLERVSTLPAT